MGLERLQHIRHVVLDMDGTVYIGNRVFSTTEPFLRLLRSVGIGHSFVTNNSSLSVEQYVEKLQRIGIPTAAENIFTSSHATIEYLGARHAELRDVFVLGTSGLRDEMRSAGFQTDRNGNDDWEPDAVIVGFDTHLTYERLSQAATWIKRGKLYLATHPDLVCPAEGDLILPDCGAICACLEHATGRKPDVVLGKPSRWMIDGVLQRLELNIDQVAVVGDRLYTDIEMACQSGALGVLVLTGETNREAAESSDTNADLIVDDLAELGIMLQRAVG